MSFRPLVLVAALSCAAILPAADPVSFADEVKPLLDAKCLLCHNSEQKMGELDLSSRDAMLTGGAHGPALVPGEPAESRIYLHVSGQAAPAMPLGGTIAPREVELLRAWIEQGGAVETAAAPGDDVWWAFQPPRRPEPPAVEDPEWREHPIDAFLKAKLEKAGLEPAPLADRRTLIRRLYLDLHGLLPPPEEIEAFIADPDPNAYSKLVEQLLASPRYGERWGRHWLDLVRYADSAGYEHDYDYPNAWRYRDYVIRSFNEDKPYDRFVIEQLAGDELSDAGFDDLIATGFYRVGPRILYREKDNPDYRYTYLDDMIGTTSRAFLALTVDCARCHDHKFDPIKQLDYYRMMAIFFPYIRYEFPLAPPEEVERYEAAKQAADERIRPLKERIAEIEAPYKRQKFEKILETFPVEIQEAVHTPEEMRTPGQQLLAAQVLSIGGGGVGDLMSDADRSEVQELKAQIKGIEAELPPEPPLAMGVRDGDYRSAPDGLGDEVQPGKGDREVYENAGPFIPSPGEPYEPPQAHLLPTADYRYKGAVVEPGLPEALAREADFRPQPPGNGRVSTGRRLALARWIASPDNPLTARVAVNRIWQHHFGRGLVVTSNNFGRMGERPTHPELLDWLATEFVAHGWSMKELHRLIVSSRAYRSASAFATEAALEKDPDNRLLWRYPARRLEAEILRDVTLQTAGNLNVETGGEPFFPPIPEEVRLSFPKGRWEMTEPGPAVWRRSIYSYWKRGLRYPMFETFDQPNPNVACERRSITTVPTQALTLLNNEFVLSQAEAFAERVRAEAGEAVNAQLDSAYSIALARTPTETEREANRAFLARQRDYHYAAPDPAQAALVDLCDVLLNLNEFVYLP